VHDYDHRSGLYLARQAHEAGAVAEAERLPSQQVEIQFVYRGTAREAADYAEQVTDLICVDPLVHLGAAVSVKERT
jgi:hypothetical protein